MPQDDEALRAFIYDRNSRITGRGSTSTSDQSAENRRFCAARGWNVAAEFEDPGRSASRYSTKKRPDFDAMIQRIETGIRPGARHAECDVLVVWAASRATRDLKVYVQLRDLCERARVLLCYNGTTYDLSKGHDRFVTGLGALQAELEADNTRDGILRTTRANAERGRPHGKVPYGYRRVYDERTGALIEQLPDPVTAPVVQEIAERVASGQSMHSIARDLNERKIAAPASGEWTPSALGQMLLKPTYIGSRTFQGKVIGEAQWPALLDETTYYACVKLLRDPGRRTQRGSTVKYLLSGVVFCGKCGPEMRRPLRSARVGRDVSYACVACFGVSCRVGMLDDYVQAAVLAYVERPEFAEALAGAGGDAEVQRDLAQAQELERELREARELSVTVVDGRLALSAVSLAAMEVRLLPLIEAARERARDRSVPAVVHRLGGPGARERWDGLDLAQKRVVLRGVVRPWLHTAGRGVRSIRPGRVQFEWLR